MSSRVSASVFTIELSQHQDVNVAQLEIQLSYENDSKVYRDIYLCNNNIIIILLT